MLWKSVTHLQSQLFRFDNVNGDSKQLEFLTGLNGDTWDRLLRFLGVRSQHNVLSRLSAASEVKGKKVEAGRGRVCALSLED